MKLIRILTEQLWGYLMNKSKTLILYNLILNNRQISDIELLLNGAFHPVNQYLSKKDYESVLTDMRLSTGELWPIPIVLDINEDILITNNISENSKIALRDHEGFLIATLTISEIWEADKKNEAKHIFGTNDLYHPGVKNLYENTGDHYISGTLEKNELPKHYDYSSLRHTPETLKKEFKKLGWDKIVAFQTRNPMHRAHKEIALLAALENNANLLIHPVVGPTKPGDVDHFTRVRCYEKILKYFPKNQALLSLLPLAMRMAGPREALWHAIIRKNYGCTHIIIGRDHAGPGQDKNGNPFYGPYDAQDLLIKHEDELEIKMVPFKMLVYVKEIQKYMEIDKVSKNHTALSLSGTELRSKLENNENIPEWFTYPEIVEELHRVYPPKNKQGFTIFFSGLSGSGKSTIANGLLIKLLEHGKRRVTLLDGDIVRTHLSSELGFSKEHREINVKRIGYVASEITKNGGIAICAPIAPFEQSRAINRELISKYGSYIEIFVSTPIEECEKRDVKGLYAKARAGILKGFTGIDDPYEKPINSELKIDTTSISPEHAVDIVCDHLLSKGFIE